MDVSSNACLIHAKWRRNSASHVQCTHMHYHHAVNSTLSRDAIWGLGVLFTAWSFLFPHSVFTFDHVACFSTNQWARLHECHIQKQIFCCTQAGLWLMFLPNFLKLSPSCNLGFSLLHFWGGSHSQQCRMTEEELRKKKTNKQTLKLKHPLRTIFNSFLMF